MNDNQHYEGDVTIEEAQTVKVEPSRSNPATPIAIVIGAAIIGAALYFGPGDVKLGGTAGNNGTTPPLTAPTGNDTGGATVNVTAGDLPVLGNASAPVLIVEWGDYQCPFCGRFFSQVEPQLKEQYIETGKVRFAYRDFAFLGQESVDAAVAARCANEQGKFWEYHDKLFSSQQGENEGAFSRDNLKKFARELRLDTAKFNSCLDSDKYVDAVTADTNAGRDAGVSGTPTTFINGRVVNGAQPFANFQKIIEEELKK